MSSPYYTDYSWRNGKPVGKHPADPFKPPQGYKIVIDPYFKRISIEKYLQGCFDKVVYDSQFLDFRKLKPNEQTAWSRELLQEDNSQTVNLIRDHYDRLILIETSRFEQSQCRECRISSIHGVLLSTHRMYYKALGDQLNGVILYDLEEKPVMQKEYEVDPISGEFTNLIREKWE
jgi:hypothetical protein